MRLTADSPVFDKKWPKTRKLTFLAIFDPIDPNQSKLACNFAKNRNFKKIAQSRPPYFFAKIACPDYTRQICFFRRFLAPFWPPFLGRSCRILSQKPRKTLFLAIFHHFHRFLAPPPKMPIFDRNPENLIFCSKKTPKKTRRPRRCQKNSRPTWYTDYKVKRSSTFWWDRTFWWWTALLH